MGQALDAESKGRVQDLRAEEGAGAGTRVWAGTWAKAKALVLAGASARGGAVGQWLRAGVRGQGNFF